VRGIADGDIIRLFNARGACLAAVRVTEAIVPVVVQLPTGAWYDPMNPEEEAPLCVHVLTRDIGTSSSSFAQGCTGQLTTVEVERSNGNLPPIRAFDPM
jgi:biotin/methionine sulfoxide reductase